MRKLRRTVRWRVRLDKEGAAEATAAFTLANDGPASGLPRYIIRPYDSDFRPGQNEQIATPCTSPGGTGSPGRPSTASRPASRRRPTSAGWPSPSRSACRPNRPLPSATSSPARRRPSGSATTASATACCSARRRPSAPTRPGSPWRRRGAGSSPPCLPRPGRRSPKPRGRAPSTGSASWSSN
jgi:hypothetical protein